MHKETKSPEQVTDTLSKETKAASYMHLFDLILQDLLNALWNKALCQ